ncbi:MAG TPA: polysaccharide pyruvyl transferase family protein [Burkholderiales bacterium]|nr:polysaccharide pyruvyl transferase family protein [Burkholderiales bacterium]
MTAKTQVRIGITGSYGGLNLGDEAILQSMIVELRREIPDVEITVFSRDAEDTKRRHGVERSVPVRKVSRAEVVPEVQRLDLLLFGGGGILYDAEAKVYLREVLVAKELGVPVMLYAVGAGPLKDPANQAAVREALEGVKAITVRERAAQQVLEEAGVHRDVVVTADPALLMKPEPLQRNFLKGEGLEGRRHLIGMSVREPGVAAPDLDVDRYHGLLANAADFMIDRWDADIVFVPMERAVLDTQHSHAVVAKMLRPQRASVLKGEYSSGQILAMMSRFQFAVGMRLHFLIFAALTGTPFVALPYAGKVSGFLEDLKLPSPPLNLVSPGRLIAHLDASWDRRRSLKAQLGKAVPALQERARQTAKIAAQLLSHRRLRDVKAAA